MVRYEPTVPGNLRALWRHDLREGSAPLGPVAIGPGQGALRFVDGAGVTSFQVQPGAGARIRVNGDLRDINPWAGELSNRMGGAESTLTQHRKWLDGHGPRIDKLEQWNRDQDSTLSDHRRWLDGHGPRIDKLEQWNRDQDSTLGDHRRWLDGHGNRIGNLEGRATASPGDVSAVRDLVNQKTDSLNARLSKLEQQVAYLASKIKA